MGRPKETHWLMGPMPYKKNPTGEDRLWWGVVREAARDLRYAGKSAALDAGDWLTGTGTYLVSLLFRIDTRVTSAGLVSIIRDRNRYHEEPLDLPIAKKG